MSDSQTQTAPLGTPDTPKFAGAEPTFIESPERRAILSAEGKQAARSRANDTSNTSFVHGIETPLKAQAADEVAEPDTRDAVDPMDEIRGREEATADTSSERATDKTAAKPKK